jgi:hypothetical protein
MSPVEIFAPLGAFFMITVVVALVTRLIATAMLNKTIREALKSHPESVPLLVARLEARQPWADALLGWIFLAFAAALVGLALFEDPHDRIRMLQSAVIPVVIGLTVLIYCRIAGRASAP